MVKITYGQMNTPHLMPAFQKLDNYSSMPLSVAYKVMRAKEKIEVEMKRFVALSLKLDEQYGKKDENGKLLRQAEYGLVQYETKEAEEEHGKKWEELVNVEVELKCDKLPAQYLEGARLSPNELRAISFLIEMPGETAEDVEVKKAVLKAVGAKATGKKK